MRDLVWVVGRGGLLGSWVERTIGSAAWHPERAIDWSDKKKFQDSMAAAVQAFRSRLLEDSRNSWCVYWCAGKGVVGTPADRLDAETASFRFFLNRLGTALCDPPSSRTGRIFLASSAGGVYGGSTELPSTEVTPPHPISDYGRAKLAQEEVLLDWASSRPGVSTLVGRLSNLYGPGQHFDKPQGLISQMSRCLIFGVPVHIYVSLDTIRDYLFVQDAAKWIVAAMNRLCREAPSGGQHIIKIFSSGRETTVAGLIGVFRQIAKRKFRVVLGLKPARSQQPARLLFRSINYCEEPPLPPTELLDGVSRLHRHQFSLFLAGRLLPPQR